MIRTLDVRGLTSNEAAERQQQFGMNQITSEAPRPYLLFFSKFRGVIPYILEFTLLLQLLLGKWIDAAIIGLMLVVNAVIGASTERRAQKSLALLQNRLTIQTRTLRDGTWQLLVASELVPDDIVRLRVGDMIPADARVLEGEIAVDQSSLTGESELVEHDAGSTIYAASVIRRGECIATVAATGMNTSYSKTATLVQTAETSGQGDLFVYRVVRYLMVFTAVLIAAVLVDALIIHLALADALLFALALLIAAVPVSLPVTFTLATAIGSRQLARHGVLATRLSAIREAAGMDVLCSDKTGTITRNHLTVTEMRPYHKYSRKKLLRYAALASDDATHDPIDVAIANAARDADVDYGKSQRVEFTPFDPSTKRTEALIRKGKKEIRVLKGSPHIIGALARDAIDMTSDIEQLAGGGNRCIAIAVGKGDKPFKVAGLVALQDPPREDAASVVSRLREMGVRVMMVTGDGLATARSIAHSVGIDGETCTVERLHEDFDTAAEQYDVFARVYPEDKYKLVQALQRSGHVVGMTGDGINDAPAIRQAEIGIAVDNATDITKSAAGLVLTAPGLKDMLAAIEIGRSIFQRISTYTLNKVIKTFHMGAFLTLGLILTGTLLVQPTHLLLLVLANDLVSMSLTTDHVRPSAKPDRWQVSPLLRRGLVISIGWLLFSFATYYVGRDALGLNPARLQTLLFLMLVCVSQANVYLIREKRFFWRSRPSMWMLLATTFDILLVSTLSLRGVLMAAVYPSLLLLTIGATVVFMIVLDLVKVLTFSLF